MKDRSKRGFTVSDAVFEGNTSGWEALDFKVFIKKDEIQEKTKGGIVIPNAAMDLEEWNICMGVVVSIGSNAFSQGRRDDGCFYMWDRRPEVGDRVIVKDMTGMKFVGDDGETYFVYPDKDIIAVPSDG